MSKKKNGKVIPMKPVQQSAENYIRTQARLLPIEECLITEDWEDTGMCNIIVARKHKNGHFTAGMYLVDLYCLGLKEAIYEFNLDPEDYEYMKEKGGDMQPCTYVFAHNMIYGAIAFADDYGFKPDKDFALTKYILEEDDEAVELMELEFGLEGKPFYVRGPYDDEVRIKQIKSTLERTAGAGNFTIIEDINQGIFDEDMDEWLDDMDDGDEYDDDDDDDDGMSDEQLEILDDLLYRLKPINKVYEKAVRTPEATEKIKQSTVGKGYWLTAKPVKNEYTTKMDSTQEDLYFKLKDLFENSEFTKAIKEIKEAIKKYPHNPMFYNLLQACYIYSEQADKSKKLAGEMYGLFPRDMFAMVGYATMGLDGDEPEKALAAFIGKTDLDELYPGQKQFNRHEAAIYYGTMARYFTAIGDIDTADTYVNAILKKDLHHMPNQTVVNIALQELLHVKVLKLKTVLKF